MTPPTTTENSMVDDIKRHFDAAVKKIHTEMQSGFERLNLRFDHLNQEHTQLKNIVTKMQTELTEKNELIEANKRQIESLKRHSYAFDVLLHGVPEKPSEDWRVSMDLVKQFLTTHGCSSSFSELEDYGHRLGPRKQKQNQDLQSDAAHLPVERPRPILFRMRSRPAQIQLVTALGKSKLASGHQYLTNHLTPGQIENLKSKHRSGLKRGQDRPSQGKIKEARHSNTHMMQT